MHYFPNLDEAADPWMKVIRNPFQRQLAEILRAAQDGFLELTTNGAANDSFNSCELPSFWVKWKEVCPLRSAQAKKLLLPFSTTYLCESGFSPAVAIKTKTRDKLELEDAARFQQLNLACLPCFARSKCKVQTNKMLTKINGIKKTNKMASKSIFFLI